MADKPTLQETVLGSGAGGPLSVPTPWNIGPGFISYNGGGVVIGSPAGGNRGIGTVNAQTYFINGVQLDLAKYLPFTGGAMTGMLTLFQDPVVALDAATKQYVDARITFIGGTFASYLPLTGGTLTGALALAADPTTPGQAATKRYVDAATTGIIAIPDAPSDGTTYGRNNAAWVDTSIIDMGVY